MKLFVALVCIGFAAALPLLGEDFYKGSFEMFKTEHSKVYSSAEEHAYRFGVFRSNLALIREHNERFDAGEETFALGVNQFADMTNDEYRAMLGYRKSSSKTAAGTHVASGAALPDTVDWREHSPQVVAAPKNQGQCGSCWAFSAVGAMEGAYALSTGKLVLFSEQELVDCVNGGVDDCSHGGEMQEGFDLVIETGIETESDYPYTAKSLHKCKYEKSKSAATFSSYNNVTSFDEAALQAAIVDVPTISVAIDASAFSFQLYSHGVYDNAKCKNKEEELDHGVLLVGYGTESGKDYWLIKNSWGGSWGDHGYIKMRRNADNQCGVATDASYPVV